MKARSVRGLFEEQKWIRNISYQTEHNRGEGDKIPHRGVAMMSNSTVCNVCLFKPTVFGETIYLRSVGVAVSCLTLVRTKFSVEVRTKADLHMWTIQIVGLSGLSTFLAVIHFLFLFFAVLRYLDLPSFPQKVPRKHGVLRCKLSLY